MISPTVAEWAKMTQAQKAVFNRRVNFGSAAAGAVAGFFAAGPVGAAAGALGAVSLASWYTHKNLPGGLF